MAKTDSNFQGFLRFTVINIIIIVLVIAGAAGYVFYHKYRTDHQKYQFSELGVAISLPSQLRTMKDSVTTVKQYSGGSQPTSVQISQLQTPGYSALAAKCAPPHYPTPYYFTSLFEKAKATTGETVLGRTGNFVIISTGSDNALIDTCKDKTTQQQLKSLAGELNSALQQAFQTAKAI